VLVAYVFVTLTTMGYGDISPQTPLGRTLAAAVMIIGYGINAIPIGIVTVELAQAGRKTVSTQACPSCSVQGHAASAVFCK
jgi:voltage-gated potassium channel